MYRHVRLVGQVGRLRRLFFYDYYPLDVDAVGFGGVFNIRRTRDFQRDPYVAGIILHKNQVTTLICNNIGNCMLEVLSRCQIRVIPGISGAIDEVLTLHRQNKLRPGKNFTCTENGCICGDCPGNF